MVAKEGRARYHGQVAAIANAIVIATPGSLKYHEGLNESRLDVNLIMQQQVSLRRLRELYPPLVFRLSDIQRAVALIEQDNRERWKMNAIQTQDFKKFVPLRWHAMLSHVAQAQRRNPQPAWVRRLFASDEALDSLMSPRNPASRAGSSTPTLVDLTTGESASASDASQSTLALVATPASTRPTQQWAVGWHPETNCAWRCPSGDLEAKEYTTDVYPQQDPLAPAMAKWPDGYVHEVVDLESDAQGEAGGQASNRA